jgi:hypothetical protein
MQLVNGQFDKKEFYDLSEEAWTPQEILNHFQIPKMLCKTPQLQAGILFFRNDIKSRNFLTNWFELMVYNNYTFLKDYPQFKTEDLEFRGHRYDQSIFSPLYKLSKLPTISDETWFEPHWDQSGANFPIWAMRNKTGKDFRKNYFWNLYQRIMSKVLDARH